MQELVSNNSLNYEGANYNFKSSLVDDLVNYAVKQLVSYKYDDYSITFAKGNAILINATEMAKPFGKSAAHWLRNQSTKDFIDAYSELRNRNSSDLVIVTYGDNGGTWMHEDIALEFARWLSPKFAIWCNDHIKELLTKGHTEAKPMSTAQMLLMQAQLAVEMENRINEQQRQINQVASDVQEIKDIHAEATERLLAAPMSDMEVPAETLRGQINELVRSYARKTGANISDIWQKIYRTLYYRFHINIEGRRKKKSENKLDIAERCNLLDKVFACASQVVREGM